MKGILKNNKAKISKKGRQVTKEAVNTLILHLHKQARNEQHKCAPIAPLPIVLGTAEGLAATNAATSLATGDAPLSWLGNIMSSILGFSSNAASQRSQIKMDKLAKHIRHPASQL